MSDKGNTAITIFVIGLFFISYLPIQTVSSETIREPLRIYSATMPFGVFSLKGDVSGGILFTHGSLEGSEIYSVKYLEKGLLKTMIMDAVDTPLIIDGTLQVVRVYRHIGQVPLIHFGDSVFYTNSTPTYEFHIPYLPVVDPLTEDWAR